jgi:hypothetical protein
MNWMSKKVGVKNQDKKNIISHTVKNSRLEQRVRKSYMNSVCQDKSITNLIDIPNLSEISKKEDRNNYNNIEQIFDTDIFNEKMILMYYQNLKYINFD